MVFETFDLTEVMDKVLNYDHLRKGQFHLDHLYRKKQQQTFSFRCLCNSMIVGLWYIETHITVYLNFNSSHPFLVKKHFKKYIAFKIKLGSREKMS